MLRLRRIMVDMLQHLLIAVRTGDLQHLRMHFADLILFRAETAGDVTLPFSFNASPIASSDSCTALSIKPQVLTITISALS